MATPIVFISYSHSDTEHISWVVLLATKLRENGIDVILDQWDLHPGDDIALFMESSLKKSDRVLVICSSSYVEKSNGSIGGVAYEKMILNAQIVNDVRTRKYIPIIPLGEKKKETPVFLGARLYIDFSEPKSFNEKFEILMNELCLGYPKKKPVLGEFRKGEVKTMSDKDFMLESESWFRKQYERSYKGFLELGFQTYMEIKFSVEKRNNHYDQRKLFEAVDESQIHTFGWPIGILIKSNEQFRPKPLSNGIFLEGIEDSDRGLHNKSYDYWALNCNGDFYLLKSIFEDMRDSTAIFFNTRIVRTTETLLFCEKLYSKLGLTGGNPKVDIEINYSGLKGRILKSSNSTRRIEEKITYENEIRIKETVSINEISLHIIDLTKKFTQPLFNIFDFYKFNDSIYEQIVTDFINGKVT
ncbi:MAG: toll/interleukin-1 receptor domain-containing protein [Candidatus Atribacteria bacterium]|nr:toll/interleukin-1 receptor domain-containing protein [Candidatus Atribacteria bacterium]